MKNIFACIILLLCTTTSATAAHTVQHKAAPWHDALVNAHRQLATTKSTEEFVNTLKIIAGSFPLESQFSASDKEYRYKVTYLSNVIDIALRRLPGAFYCKPFMYITWMKRTIEGQYAALIPFKLAHKPRPAATMYAPYKGDDLTTRSASDATDPDDVAASSTEPSPASSPTTPVKRKITRHSDVVSSSPGVKPTVLVGDR